ncbi:MAG: cytochrome P450 [Proteobacteria bacterium]|nr:cytochrome P450 [Pseudomonadota bacterium]
MTTDDALRPASEIPRATPLQMLRNILSQGRGRLDMYSGLDRLYREHGPVVAALGGPIKMFNLYGPDANRKVLLDRDQIFSAKRPWDLIMGRIFPNGLLLRDGAVHKHHRKIMHLAFQRPPLREYTEQMNPMIEEHLETWRGEGGRLLAFRKFKELTLDLAASIFVGADLGPGTRRMNAVFEHLVAASMSRVRLRIPGLEFYRGLRGREFMIDYLQDLIAKKRSGDGRDLFSRLCRAETEEGERLQDQEIIDHMIFLMMAAHDTTTSTLTSITYELAKHPEWQERVREESRALGRPAISLEDVERLEGLTWVMRETLRRYPPLPVIPRIATEDFSFGGFRIPAKSMVIVSPIHTHRMDEWWDEPGRFDPERFSPARAEHERHTHSWIPFGGGPHHCIGLRFAEVQVMAVVHQMVQRYRWSVPDGYEMPVQQAPISKPRDELPIDIRSID